MKLISILWQEYKELRKEIILFRPKKHNLVIGISLFVIIFVIAITQNWITVLFAGLALIFGSDLSYCLWTNYCKKIETQNNDYSFDQ